MKNCGSDAERPLPVKPEKRGGRRKATPRPSPPSTPVHESSSVALNLPPKHVTILRQHLLGGLDGALRDLQIPRALRDPVATAKDAAIFLRLLEALEEGRLDLPDEEARIRMQDLARSWDEADDYELIASTHDAHWALVDLLGGAQEGD